MTLNFTYFSPVFPVFFAVFVVGGMLVFDLEGKFSSYE